VTPGDATDAVHAALHSCGDTAEVSFQPLVNELYVHGGLLAGTVAEVVGFGFQPGSITGGCRRFVSGHCGMTNSAGNFYAVTRNAKDAS
jgi:hypothetical protein